VQRIRTATPDAWGTPHIASPAVGQYLPSPMQVMQSMLPPQYAQSPYPAYGYQHAYTQQPQVPEQLYYQPPQPLPQLNAYAAPQQYIQPNQRQATPMPGAAMSPMMDRMDGQRAQPVGGQLATQPPANAANAKISRFVWFVAGAAFGITFAFFATGFFNGAKAQKDEAPAATAPAAAPTAPPVAGAPTAPPVALAAPTAPVTPATLPTVAPGTFVLTPVPPQGVAPVVRTAPPAPPPRAPRFQAPPPPRRPAPPVSQGPRNLGGGGPGADDDRPSAPPAPPPGAELGDLLGAGLKP